MDIHALRFFCGISDLDRSAMLKCFGASVRSYKPGEISCKYRESLHEIGLLCSGSARIERIDSDGMKYVLDYLSPGDIFGASVAFANTAADNVSVVCYSECEILFMLCDRLSSCCGKSCACHAALLDNMLALISDKAMRLSERVEILSNRTIRGRLLHYFRILTVRNQNDSFYVPFSMTALADFICADRSAMMRELKNMRDDGLIATHKRLFTVL